MLGALLEETHGVVGVALGTDQGELRAIAGIVEDGDASAAVAASVTSELNKVGTLLGLGVLGVASIKAQTTAFVFAQQAGAAVVIEMDPRSQLGELEAKLCAMPWASEAPPEPAINRTPTVPRPGPTSAQFSAPARFDRPSSSSGATPLPLPLPPPPPQAAISRHVRPTPPPPPGHLPSRAIPPPIPASASTAMRAANNGPVFTGDLEEFNLPDLLEFLRNTHRTGLLECVGEAGIGTVELSRGMIVGADSPNAIDLREYFLMNPEIDADRRRQLSALPAEYFSDGAIDTMLVERGILTVEDAESARTARVYSAFREMMAWTSGRFSFEPGVPISSNPSLQLSAQSVLMHIFQEQDEQNR